MYLRCDELALGDIPGRTKMSTLRVRYNNNEPTVSLLDLIPVASLGVQLPALVRSSLARSLLGSR